MRTDVTAQEVRVREEAWIKEGVRRIEDLLRLLSEHHAHYLRKQLGPPYDRKK